MISTHHLIHFCEVKQQPWQPKMTTRRGSISVRYGDERYVVCKLKTAVEAEKGFGYEC